jgi:hypothetical protein
MAESTPSPDSSLVNPAPSAEEGEVLLRSRDVQALSRTFRRLAEIQDGLAEHMRELEEERQSKWMLPAVAIASLVLGAGMALFGIAWMQKNEEVVPVQVDLSSLPAASIQVQAPEGAINAEMLAQLSEQLDEMKRSQSQDRRMISDLGSQLIQGEMSALTMLKQMRAMEAGIPLEAIAVNPPAEMGPATDGDVQAKGDVGGGQGQAVGTEASGDKGEVGPDELGYPADVWLGAMNGLMAVDGYPHFRFQEATRVKGKPRLNDVIFFIWSEDGLLQTIVRAQSVDFFLQESTFSMRLHFRNGSRTRDGVKTALPAAGLTVSLPDINVPAWVAHFPEIAPKGVAWQPIGKVPPPAPGLVDPNPEGTQGNEQAGNGQSGNGAAQEMTPLERTRRALDNLLSEKHSFGHYRLESVDRIEGDALRIVRLSWFDSNGILFKYIEADSLRVRSRGEGWIELILENGSFIRLDKKTPFRDPEYRIHLPNQKVGDWRATGLPVADPE